MPRTVRIDHAIPQADEAVEIEISLGNTCNYACSYCPADLHDGSLGWIEPEHVKRFLDRIDQHYAGQVVLIQYTGGEPTVYPGFEEILKYGNELGFRHSIISNASRTLRFWEKFAGYFDRANLTFHQEFAELDHFRKVVEILSKHIPVHVNFTMIPELFEEIYETATTLVEMDNISLTLKALRINFGSQLYPYEPEQMERMKKFRNKGAKFTSNYKYPRGPMKKVYEDGTEETKAPSRFVVDGDNQWEGWDCWIGLQQICVKPNGDIYRGVCRVGGKLGNVRGDYEFPDKPIRCTKQYCSCPTDIMTTKVRTGD